MVGERERAERRRVVRKVFLEEFVRVAKKLKEFGLKPHEVMALKLFTKTPYVMGKEIFKQIL